jgi:hypothetical protein
MLTLMGVSPPSGTLGQTAGVYLLVRWRPILRDSPLAPKNCWVDLAAVSGPVRGVKDRLRAGSPSGKARLSGRLAKQAPLAFRESTKNDKARCS